MKDMLTEQDIKRIGVEVASVIEHNINPQFEGVYSRLDKIEGRLDGVEDRLGKVETRLDTEMVTKTYLDEKMGNLESKLLSQDRQSEKKIDALIDALVERRGLKPSDAERLEQVRVFPRRA